MTPKTLTSEDSPIRVDWIRTSLWPGQLGLTIAPGKQGPSASGQVLHARDLESDLTTLRMQGAVALVSLLEPDEARKVGLEHYDAAAEAQGLEVLHFPVPDVNVPQDPVAFAEFTDEVMNRLLEGQTVVAHCLGGLGRAGTLAACLLVQAGMDAPGAVARVREDRPGTIETPGQLRFVERFGGNGP